jgi:hypothetical protein
MLVAYNRRLRAPARLLYVRSNEFNLLPTGMPQNGQPRLGDLPTRAVVCLPRRRNPAIGTIQFGKRTCKPNSVVCGHSSRRRVAADTHQRPTRRFRHLQGTALSASGRCATRAWLQARVSLPIWSCSVWGLPCLRLHSRSGTLLPHHFTLTPALSPCWTGEPFQWSQGCPPPNPRKRERGS